MVGALFVPAIIATGVLVACGEPPPPPTPVSTLERGAQVYTAQCQVCHPGGYIGAGPALRPVLPARSDDDLTQSIRHGKNRMPGFGDKVISDADLKALIEYMRSW
jgi:mono/diheme cytochrome c family protein